jgi:CheY-like chemotaxis protein
MNSSGEQATKAGETVLVVEDEVLLRLSIAAYLRDCGYKVIEAADADEAVLVLKQPDLEIDVLFTDVEMAGDMDGFGLAQ